MKQSKNVLSVRLFGVAAIALAMVISMTGCSNPADSGGGGKTLLSIAVTTQPTKISYAIGEELDTKGMVVTATYSDGTTAAVAAKDYTISGYDKTTAGVQTITVKYKEKTAIFTVTVGDSPIVPVIPEDTPITVADITIVAPVKGVAPATTVTSTAERFTAGTVTWSPADNPFKPNEAYTATVTLTAKTGFTFTGFIEANAKVNGDPAVVSKNTGETVTLSHTFAKTNVKGVSSIAIKSPPTTLTYTHGDELDLAGLVVTLHYDDSTTEDVAASEFSAKNVTANPAHDIPLEHTTYDGKPITIIYGDLTQTTDKLTVSAKSVSDLTIEPASITALTYTGSALTPTVTVKHTVTNTTRTLKPGTDYTVSYTNNTNAGTATITVTGAGDYKDTQNKDFTINPKVMTFAIDAIAASTYTGSEIKPNIVVKDGQVVLAPTANFTAAYSNNTNAGTATVTVTGAGNYAGSSGSATFTINKATPVVDDYDIDGNLLQVDTAITAFTVTAKTGKSGGDVSVKYADSTDLPTTGGVYAVTFDVAEASDNNWNAATLSVGTLNIAFGSISSLGTWLATQDANTAATAYPVRVNVSDLGGSYTTAGSLGKTLKDNETKYVDLDLSGSEITSIGMQAFVNCTNLAGVTIPNSVTTIEVSAFSGCSGLTSITIPNSVTTIDNQAFSFCTGLTSVTIPDSVTNIIGNAFAGCTSLTSVSIGKGVTSISWSGIFNLCDSLATITVDPANTAFVTQEGIVYNKAKTAIVFVPPVISGAITIPDSVTEIGYSAFNGRAGLTSVTIGNGVTSIGMQAFANCSGLTSLSIGDSVTTIDGLAFQWCNITNLHIGKSLTSIDNIPFVDNATITVDPANTALKAQEGILYSATAIVFVPQNITGAITIPDSVTSIKNGAFQYRIGLTSVTIGSSVESIGDYAFSSCTGLTSVIIPDSVTSIGYSAFSSCTSLTSVTIGSVTSIGSDAFSNCPLFTNLTIGKGVTSLDNLPLRNVINISAVEDNPNFSSHEGILYNKEKTAIIFVPKNKTEVILPDTLTSIGDDVFRDCTGLTSITIGSGVASIGVSAFQGLRGLTSITIPNSVTSIGAYAFFDCTNLLTVTFADGPNSVSDFNQYAFIGDLSTKYLAGNGGQGTYVKSGYTWSKQ